MADIQSGATGGWAQHFNLQKLKEGLKKYGRTGIVVYLTLSTCVTTGFYIAIERNLDVEGLLGLNKPTSTEEVQREPTWMERMLTGKGSHLAMAFVCSKMMVPIKLPIALAITPYVHRWQQRLLTGALKSPRSSGGRGDL